MRFSRLVLLGVVLSFTLGFSWRGACGQVSVLTWHYDNARSSVNSKELLLAPTNVNSKSFAKLFSLPVDGYLVGHPLYVPSLNINGVGVHNVVFAATMHDSVYAFDADNPTGGPLWKTSLFKYSPAGATTVDPYIKGCNNGAAYAEVGIVSTPVIDPVTLTMYVVAETYENSQVVHRLHALDITSGLEQPGWPVTIKATFDLNGSTNTFADLDQMNRPGLLLVNGHVYIAWGGPSCNVKDQGWVMSYNAATATQEGTFDTEPGRYWAAIWQKGAGISADADGYIYAETGEGRSTPDTNFGTSVLKFSQTGTSLTLTDWFMPFNSSDYLDTHDLDLNDGVLILPDQPGPFPHELIAEGKEGTIYVLDRSNMGHLCSGCTTTDTQIVQELPTAVGAQTGTPVYWNGRVYFDGGKSLQAYPLVNGMLVTPPAQVAMAPGGHAIITSNGNTNGILWSIAGSTSGNGAILQAADAVTLKLLYTSAQAPNQRDKLPLLAHFATPIAADGKVFVGSQSSIVVYGLIPTLKPTAGNNQSAVVGTPISITVQAADPYSGNPSPGVTVTFSDGGKGGSFSSTNVVTDANGNASNTYTLPTKVGTYALTAVASGYSTASLSETATYGPAAKLIRYSGNAQSAPVLTAFAAPIVARVVDQYLNSVPGVQVKFSDNGAGGLFSTNPVHSDVNGYAAVTYTTSTKAGKLNVTATTAGLSPLSFAEKVTPGPASAVLVIAGNNQTAPPSTQLPKALKVEVTDQYGNPIGNATVKFSDGGAGGSFSTTSPTTLANGTASVTYITPASSGTVKITASVTGVPTPATFAVNVQ